MIETSWTVTTSHILAFEGEGHVQMYVGGYTDYATQHVPPPAPKAELRRKRPSQPVPKQRKSLAIMKLRELSLLPQEIYELKQ